MKLSEKQQSFSDLFYAFVKSRLNFEHFGNNMNLTLDVLTKICTLTYVVRQIPKLVFLNTLSQATW